MKFGELEERDEMFYDPFERVPRLVLRHLQENVDEIDVEGY